MSTAAGTPSKGKKNSEAKSPPVSQAKDKGKGKGAVTSPDVSMEDDEEDDDDEEDEDEEMEEDDDEEEEEEDPEIDPSAIVGRRTRGVKVDYTSKEAFEKAGLKPEDEEDEEDEDMK